MYRYLYVEEIVRTEEQKPVTTCGIRIIKCDGAKDKEICYIRDVFTNIELGKQFAKICTREQLDPVHIFDAIENFLP